MHKEDVIYYHTHNEIYIYTHTHNGIYIYTHTQCNMYIYIHTHSVTCIYIYTHTYIHTMEYYSAIKKKEIMPFTATWIDLEIIILSEVRKRKTNTI